MGTDRSTDYGQAILVPDPRIAWDALVAATSSYTGTAPIPGQPDPDGTTGLTLTARGTQAAGDTMRVSTKTGGGVGRSGATFIWQQEAGDWQGWDAPTVMSTWAPVTWATTPAVMHPSLCALDAGQVLAVWARGTYGNTVYTSTLSAGAWAAEAAIDIGGTPAAPCCPCLLRIEDRVLLFVLVENATDEAQLRMLYSADDGATWTTGATGALPAAISTASGSTGYNLLRVRAAYLDGQILLLVWLRTKNTTVAAQDIVRQYASIDGGHSFTLVYETGTATLAEGRACPDVVVANGEFVVGWLDTTNRLPNVRRLTSASLALSAVEEVDAASTSEVWGVLNGGGKFFTDAEMILTADETGVLLISGRLPTTGNRWVIFQSLDGGDTWAPMARSSTASGGGVWWDAEDSSTYPADAVALWHQGRALVVSGFEANPGTYDGGSLISLWLGGYTTVTMPGYDAWRSDARQVTWGETWIPLDLPGDTGWTRTVAGLGTDSINSSARLAIGVPTAGSQVLYSRVPAGSVARGQIVTWALSVAGGTAGVTLTTADATEGYQLRVTLTGAGALTARDMIGATDIGTASGLTGEIAILASITGGVCSVWYRSITDQYAARTWIALVEAEALTDDAGATLSANAISWGMGSGGSGPPAHASQWRWFHWIDDGGGAVNYCGTGLGSAQFPRDHVGRRFSTVGTGIGVDAATILQAEGGPAWAGDAWDIEADDSYHARQTAWEISPSPREGARFDAATTTTLVWEASTENSYPAGGRALAVGLLGINFQGATFSGRNSSGGAWTSLGTISSAWLSSASFTRNGTTLRITGGTPARYVAHGALTGFYVDLGGGDVRRVAGNTEGMVGTSSATTVVALLRLEGIDGTEGASGTCTLYSPSVVAVVPEPANRYYQYKLEISPATTAEGYISVGKIVIGSLYWLARSPSSGRSAEIAPQIEAVQQPGGVSRVRRIGPTRRQVQLPLDDLLPSSQIWKDTPSPDYQLLATGGSPYAARHAAAESLAGLVAELQGNPVVYLDRVKKASSTTTLVNYPDPSRLLWGRFLDPITLTVQRGNEGSNASYNASGLAIVEIP